MSVHNVLTITQGDVRLAGGFPLVVMPGLLDITDYPVHRHDAFVELVVILGGRGAHIVDEQSYSIEAGDVFVVQGERAHGFTAPQQLALVNLIFDPGRLTLPDTYLNTLPGYHALLTLEPQYRERHHFRSRLRLNPHELTEAAGLLARLQGELRDRTPGFEAMALATFTHLLVYLSRCYSAMGGTSGRQVLQVARAISMIESRFAEPLTLTGMANEASMSVNNLLLLFKHATGLTPIEYLIRLRIEKGASLLRAGHSVTDAAARVGFTDSNYFSRQFKRIMGLTPREYCKRWGAG